MNKATAYQVSQNVTFEHIFLAAFLTVIIPHTKSQETSLIGMQAFR